MEAYMGMIDDVLATGTRKENRTGVDTLSTFGHYYELFWDEHMFEATAGLHNYQHLLALQNDRLESTPGELVPLLTTKMISWKSIVIEMLWFLSGKQNIEILERHGIKFWDAWADGHRNVPSAYGNFWRKFPVHSIHDSSDHTIDGDSYCGFNDQIRWVLKELRDNPMSRRLVVSAWAPGNAQYSKLPPCHMIFAFNVQNVQVGEHFKSGAEPEPIYEQRLCLHLTQRSCDLALGVPFNMASYGLLLLIFSHLTGIKPGIFAHTLLDLHIYTAKPNGEMADFDHLPGLREQRLREPRSLPRLIIDPSIKELSDIEALMKQDVSSDRILELFKLHNYNPHPRIKFKVAV